MSNLINQYINFKNGVITYNELSELDLEKTLKEQIDLLKEDMLQVEYKNNILLDVGWFPSFSLKGSFRITIVQNFDWESPLRLKKTKKLNELIEILNSEAALLSTHDSGAGS
ncbi:hypothetical protein CLV51_102403 [Chitinophaga niastensis]|uniref:Uncharacterized protein n=1 Tax=Chitinophaga niastensis TaxID=536980 RepID=A0A2P8HMW7_CHINA|nr:hypothetical protein [Chitinophaga niastensis]PSL47546.1 hypothetical protein CLV51_102403 [Chitinophaga niastensis]